MTFGKPGRPREDELLRRRQIYEAVGPLILERGVRQFSMAEAARAASLSVGGLYHYFPTKRDLVLHALTPEALARLCQDFAVSYGHLALTDRKAYLDVFHEHLVKAIILIRPAFHAAVELGAETFLAGCEAGISASLAEFMDALRAVTVDALEEDLEGFARSLRRTCLAAVLDKNCTAKDVRLELSSLTRVFFADQKRALAVNRNGAS